MAYSTVPTVATGDLWTAANHNTYIRDNFAAGVPDLFTTKGDSAWATAADTAARMAVGSNKQLVFADSALTPGVGWKHGMPYAAFMVAKNADQGALATTTDVVVVWETEVYDPDGVFGSNKFTAPVAGLYSLSVSLSFRANVGVGIQHLAMALKKNNSASGGLGSTGSNEDVSALAYGRIHSLSIIANLAASDYVEAIVFCEAGNTYIEGQVFDAAHGSPACFSGFLIR